MTKKILISLCTVALLNITSFANETIAVTPEEKADSSIHNFPIAEDIAGSNLEEQRDKYLRNKKRRLGFTRKGSYIGWGSSSIEAYPKSIDFGQKRIMSFERAFTDAKMEFVRTKKQKVAVTVRRKFFNDDRDQDDVEMKDGKLVGIAKKLLAVTEAKLDKMLVELGVDPKEFENSDVKKKRQLAENSLNTEITVRAVQDIRGIRILATFEDLKGVGVLIVQSPAYAQLAKAMVSGKIAPIPTNINPTDEIADKLENKFFDAKSLIPQYGIRVMNDNVGNRILVSFGQWSPKVTRSDSKMKINMATKAARQISYDQALSYMTQFMKSTLSLENKTALRDSDTIAQITRTNGSISEEEKSSVGASIRSFASEYSNVTIEGASVVKSWSTNHPETGHLIVGKILMWSPITQEFARQKPKKKEIKTIRKQKEQEIKSKIYQSVDFGNDDF